MNDIDFVIAWVDGSDPTWLKEKAKYDSSIDNTQDASNIRYRDWDNLKYWFRAVEEYAPWVRKIHFITWGHVPSWLNINNPKIHIVNHKDYIPKEYLPTFNSHTIELNMHRIEGLSEKFVYFNDDMFLSDYVKETDFFVDNLPCDLFGLDVIYFEKNSAGSYNGNDLEVINKHFNKDKIQKELFLKKWIRLKYGKKNLYKTLVLSKWHWFPGFRYEHLPSNFLKSTLEEVWDKEFEVLDETCKDKFRSKRNVNQWLFKYWQLASGNFYPRSYKFGRCFHLGEKLSQGLKDSIVNRTFKTICINDTTKTRNFEEHKKMVNESFEKVLPKKSSFET